MSFFKPLTRAVDIYNERAPRLLQICPYRRIHSLCNELEKTGEQKDTDQQLEIRSLISDSYDLIRNDRNSSKKTKLETRLKELKILGDHGVTYTRAARFEKKQGDVDKRLSRDVLRFDAKSLVESTFADLKNQLEEKIVGRSQVLFKRFPKYEIFQEISHQYMEKIISAHNKAQFEADLNEEDTEVAFEITVPEQELGEALDPIEIADEALVQKMVVFDAIGFEQHVLETLEMFEEGLLRFLDNDKRPSGIDNLQSYKDWGSVLTASDDLLALRFECVRHPRYR